MTPTTRLPLVERLRQRTRLLDGEYTILPSGIAEEAAALIEKQGAVVADLIEALEDAQEWVVSAYELGIKPGTELEQGPYFDGCHSRMGSINAALLAAKTLGERE